MLTGAVPTTKPPQRWPSSRRCALAIPPPQVAKVARLEAIYIDASFPLGWIVVSEAVACD